MQGVLYFSLLLSKPYIKFIPEAPLNQLLRLDFSDEYPVDLRKMSRSFLLDKWRLFGEFNMSEALQIQYSPDTLTKDTLNINYFT